MATFDALHRQIVQLEELLSDPEIYDKLKASAQEMDHRISAKPILYGWDEALSNARRALSNLRIICAEMQAPGT